MSVTQSPESGPRKRRAPGHAASAPKVRTERTGTAASFVDNYLAYLLAKASFLISSEFHRVVRDAGLSVLEWRVLCTLSDKQSETIGRIASRTLSPQPTLTRVIDRMSEAGLVVRRTDPASRRRTPVSLTPAGRRLASRLIAGARAHEDAVLGALGPREGPALKRLLRRLISGHVPEDEATGGADSGPRLASPPSNSLIP